MPPDRPPRRVPRMVTLEEGRCEVPLATGRAVPASRPEELVRMCRGWLRGGGECLFIGVCAVDRGVGVEVFPGMQWKVGEGVGRGSSCLPRAVRRRGA